MNTEAKYTEKHLFERSGLGAVSDMESKEWRALFTQLERDQTEFLAKESEFRSPDYKWPRDPLHTWSRVWEYPYAYYHLKRWRSSLPGEATPRVLDLGSGVTFFPFSAARLGCHVICTDVDPIAARDVGKAIEWISQVPGSLEFRSCDDKLPFDDQEIDAVYCISVLEHIPSPEMIIEEIRRVLKPGGLFVLTIDLDLRGDSEISPAAYARLDLSLRKNFCLLCPEKTVHPADMLISSRGPYPAPQGRGWRWGVREAVRRILGRRPRRRIPFELAVMGFAFASREANSSF